MKAKNNNFLCDNVNRVSLSLLHFGYAEVSEEWHGQNTNPDFSRLYLVTGGEAEIVALSGEKTRLFGGAWVLLPAGFSFNYRCPSEMAHIFFHLKLCDLDGRDMLSLFRHPVFLKPTADDMPFLLNCLDTSDLVQSLILRQRLEEIIFSMQTATGITFECSRFSPSVIRAIKYIRTHLSVQLTIEEIAENAFVSKSTLTKHFRSELSMSVLEYVTDVIMFEASQRLLKTSLSILAISEKYGFSDQFYFSRRFKQKFGCSPQRYRKTAMT